MYKLLIFVFLLVGSISFGVARDFAPPDTLRFESAPNENGDTIEYELIIIDPEFESWFWKNRRPMDFYDQKSLESWNAQLATQWNAAIPRGGRGGCAPTTYLDYQTNIDYGKELNYQLFYYFRFMQQRCRIFSHFPGQWR